MKIEKTFAKAKKPKNSFGLRTLAMNVILTGSLGIAAPSYAIDVDAGDWVTAPEGTDMGLVYVQHANRSQLFSKGNRSGSVCLNRFSRKISGAIAGWKCSGKHNNRNRFPLRNFFLADGGVSAA